MRKVLGGGVFDILHSGHTIFIQSLRSFGDYVVMNVMPDNLVTFRKGNDRPIRSAKDRMVTLRAIKGVDEVVSVPAGKISKTEYEKLLVDIIKPDAIVSYSKDEELINHCKKRGVDFYHVPEIPSVDGQQTADIVRRIIDAEYPAWGANYVLIRADGRILVQRRDFDTLRFPNWICFPGGGVEPGETAAQAVTREAREETGLTLSLTDCVKQFDWFAMDCGKPRRNRFFVFRVGSPTVKSLEGTMLWFTPEKLRRTRMVHDQEQTVDAQLKEFL